MGNSPSSSSSSSSVLPSHSSSQLSLSDIRSENTSPLFAHTSSVSGEIISPYDTVRFAYETYEKVEHENRKRELVETSEQVKEIIKRTALPCLPSSSHSLSSPSPSSPSSSSHFEIHLAEDNSNIKLNEGYNETEEYFLHTIEAQDTLEGLAIKYSTSVSAIKQANKLYNKQDMFAKTILQIPKPKGEEKSEDEAANKFAFELFKREMQIEDDELCRQYLQRSKYNLREAIKRYRFDLIKKESFDRKNGAIGDLPPSRLLDQEYQNDDQYLFDDDVIDPSPDYYDV